MKEVKRKLYDCNVGDSLLVIQPSKITSLVPTNYGSIILGIELWSFKGVIPWTIELDRNTEVTIIDYGQ